MLNHCRLNADTEMVQCRNGSGLNQAGIEERMKKARRVFAYHLPFIGGPNHQRRATP